MFLLRLAIASINTKIESASLVASLNYLAQELLLEIKKLFKIVIESIAVFIFAVAIVKAVNELVFRNARMYREEKLSKVRLNLGIALALSW